MGSSSSKKSNTMPTGSTISTPQLPSYMQPYVADVLSRGQELSYQPYTPYKDQRIAGFTPGQTAAQQGILGLQPAGQFNTATQFATQAGLAGLGAYQPAPNVQAPQLSQYTMGPAQEVSSRMVRAPQMTAAQTGFAPNLQTFQMEGPERVAAERASTDSFVQPGVASQYMSPYMQNVVDVQKQEAIRDAQKAQLGQNLGAARQGTYGGARQALLQGERERALGQQLGQIQATGSQAAYDAAQRQFEAEQGRGLQAQQTNIQSQLQAALSNQQAGQQVGQQNLAARLGVQELGTRTGLESALANLNTQQQANVQNQAAKLQAQGMNQEQALRAALANQQAGLTIGQQNLSALLGVQELGAQQGMQAGLANQQAELEARRLGLTGAGMGLEAAQALGGLGSAQQAAELQRYGAISGAGAEQQALNQQQLDMRYQDFLRQQQYPMQQLQQYASLLGGVPSPGPSTVTSTYSQPASLASQLAGLGMAGYGAYKTFNSAEGGEIKAYNNGGLVALAGGGSADDTPEPYTVPQSPKGLAMAYGDKQKLGAAVQQGIVDPTSGLMAAMYLDKMQTPAPQAPQGTVKDQIFGQGLASAPLPDNAFTAAEGGIVGYQSAGEVALGGKLDKLRKELEEGARQARMRGDTESFKRIISRLRELNEPVAPIERSAFAQDVQSFGRNVKEALTPSDLTKGFIGSGVDYFTKTPRERAAREEAYLASLYPVRPDEIPVRGEVKPVAPVSTLTAGLPAITPTSAPAPQVQPAQPAKEEPPVDYMVKAKELFAGVPSASMSPEELAAMKKQQGYEALMQFGANLASSKSPTLLGGLGEAAGEIAPAIMEISKAQRAEQAAKKKEDREMAITQIQTALGLEKDEATRKLQNRELDINERRVVAEEAKRNIAGNIVELMQSKPDIANKLLAAQKAPTAGQQIQALQSVLESLPLDMDEKTKKIANEIRSSLLLLGGFGGGSEQDSTGFSAVQVQ